MASKLQSLKENVFLTLYAWTKIPLIGFCTPRVIESSKTRTVLSVPLNFRTKNHLGAMYFGALAIGSELSIAMLAVKLYARVGNQLALVHIGRPLALHFLEDGFAFAEPSLLYQYAA